MLFKDLQLALVDMLSARVRNGEATERGLARLFEISQPHMHNVLKGTRILSPELADKILVRLRINVFELLDRERVQEFLASTPQRVIQNKYVPLLDGQLGPEHKLPLEVRDDARIPVSSELLKGTVAPVVVRLGADSRMTSFLAGDYALLDQAPAARLACDPAALYLVKRADFGQLRRVRISDDHVYLVADDSSDRPSAWERLQVTRQNALPIIRAKATILSREIEWEG
jgi:hypothetical protein